MTKFMIMFKADRETEAAAPACKVMPEMERLIGELSQSGVLLSTEGLYPSDRGAARVFRNASGKVTVTDGPFTEAKELIAGYVLVQAASKDEAVQLAQRFLAVAGEGAAEVREVIES